MIVECVNSMTIDLTWLCLPIGLIGFLGVITILITLSVRSRLRYAKRIQDAQARGAFADLNMPQHKSRFRRLAITALIGIFGMILSFAILVLPWAGKTRTFSGVMIVVALIFGIICSIAGLLMQREIDRRL